MLKQFLFVAGVILGAFTLVACEDESACGAEVDAALAQVPGELSGQLNLVFQAMDIPVPVTAETATDGCGLYFSMVQHVNPECGDRFSGTLSYEGEDLWSGVVSTTDRARATHVTVELTSRSAAIVEISAKITESSSALCQGQQLTGQLQAQ